MEDHVGDADAYGTIADIYTDMGDLESVRASPSHPPTFPPSRSAQPLVPPQVVI